MAQTSPAESAPELWRGLTDSDAREIASRLVCVFVAGMYGLLRSDWTKRLISALGVEKKWVNVIADFTAPPEALGDRTDMGWRPAP